MKSKLLKRLSFLNVKLLIERVDTIRGGHFVRAKMKVKEKLSKYK
jgi:hypothetical protein